MSPKTAAPVPLDGGFISSGLSPEVEALERELQCHTRSTQNAQIPLSLRNVVQKSLARDPADRYTDARRMSEDLGDSGIRNSWTSVVDPATVETWRAETPDGTYELRVIHRPRAGDFDLLVRLDQGAGLRQVFRQQYPTRGRALQARRTLLVRLVEGDRPQ